MKNKNGKNGEDFSYYDAAYMTTVVEATGYRSTHYALAELVDNSIQSGLEGPSKKCDVDIIVIEKGGLISKILVCDNAHGMSPDILRRSLILGRGQSLEDTKKNRRGLGKSSRYGAGLKQASISQCNHTEVFTWQNSKIFKSYIDTIELKSGKLKVVPKPIEAKIPEEYLKLFSFKPQTHGTLVTWEDMKSRITWKTAAGLFRNAEFELGRIYRYLINEGAVKIRLASFEEITKGNFRKTNELFVRKNDPLFLMKDCIIKDLWDKNSGFDYVDEETYDFPKIGSSIKVKYSVATKEFRETGVGLTPINSFARKNDGVSILRNGRELELRKHTWSTGDTRDRWIGVEISFDSDLDELMGVDAKKQRADNIDCKDIEDLAAAEKLTTVEFLNKIAENPTDENILIEISNSIQHKWNTLLRQIRIIRVGKGKNISNESAEAVGSDAINKRKKQTETDKLFTAASEKERKEDIKKKLLESGEITDPNEADKFAAEHAGKKLRFLFTYEKLPGHFLFDIKYDKGIYNIVINEKHPAYPNFINLLERADKIKPDDEPSAEKGLKLLFESWARMEDEAPDSLRDQLQDLRYQWGALARDFFKS